MRPLLTSRLLREVARPARRWLTLVLLGALVLAARAGDPPPLTGKEYQVKAAFLYNFLKFIEWPATNSTATNAPLVIGVADNGPIVTALAETVKARRINGHELQVKALRAPTEAAAVQVLFIPSGDGKRIAEWLRPVEGSAILTIGQAEAFARQHGMINFLLEGDKVRFEIDMEAADRAGLKVSAQLQKLAKTVRRNQ